MTTIEAKRIPLVDLLANFGHFPKSNRGNDWWYLSPFRSESTPSFKVNATRNIWHDHGAGVGGTVIDLITRLYSVDISGALKLLNDQQWPTLDRTFSFHQQQVSLDLNLESSTLKIESISFLNNPALISYLESRRIPVYLGQAYLRECRYSYRKAGQSERREYFGLGFANDQGGYELRNKFFHCSSSPKAITTIDPGREKVAVFEGFFDMLSAFTHYSIRRKPIQSIIVLNSLSMLQSALPALLNYKEVRLFLDNDDAGRKAANIVRDNHPRVSNWSERIYPQHKDFNDFLVNGQ